MSTTEKTFSKPAKTAASRIPTEKLLSPKKLQQSSVPAWAAYPPPLVGRHLIDYLEIPFVHWRVICGSLILSILAGAVALIVWPRTYESEAKLLINVGRESVALDPTATTGQTLMLQKTQEEEVNSALEVLSSRQVAELVVDQLGAQPILAGALASSEESAPKSPVFQKLEQAKLQVGKIVDAVGEGLLQLGIRDAVSDRDRAIREVIKSVQIYAPKKSTAVTIHAESKTPEMAQALAAAITTGFLDRHFSLSRTEGSHEFFTAQTQSVESHLNEAMLKRSQFMQQSKVVSANDMRRILTDQLGAVELEVLLTRGDLEQSLAEIEDISKEAEAAPSEIVAAKNEDDDMTWSGMRQKVFELEVQEKQLSTRFSSDNAQLMNAREQLAGARSILEEMSKDSVKRSTTPNPVRIRLEEELQKLRTRVVGLHSKLAEKEKQHTEIEHEIDELLAFELKLAEMDREIASLEASHGLLKSKLEEARVIDELQSEEISNVSIYQPANFVERPSSPSKPLVAILFPLVGLMFGGGLALVRETGKKTLRTAAHVESKLGFPTLSTIPYVGKLRTLSRLASPKFRNPIDSQCQEILSAILLSGAADSRLRGKSVGVIGVDANCGASTLASSLAVAASRACALQTVLIDADVRSATVSKAFKLHRAAGLAELLNGTAEQADCIQHGSIENLEFVSASAADRRGQLELSANVFSNALAEFQVDNDLVVVDLPPANRPDRTNGIIEYLDFVVVVFESDKTDEARAKRLLQMFANDKQTIGIVLNKTRSYVPRLLLRFIS